MAISDIVIIALISLFALLGLIKGFFKTLISLLGTIVCLVGAFFLTRFLTDKLLEIQFVHNLILGESGSLFSVMLNWFPSFNGLGVGASEAEIAAQTESWGILSGFVTKIIMAITNDGAYVGMPLQNCVAMFFAKLLFMVLLFIVIFIIFKIIVGIINAIATAAREKAALRGIDRLFGFILGAVKGAAFVAILFLITGIIITLEFMAPVRSDMEKSFIAKPVNDFVTENVIKYINIEALTGGLIPNAPEAHTPTAAENSVTSTLSIFANLDMFSSANFSYESITADNYDSDIQVAIDRIKVFIDELNLKIQQGKYAEDIVVLQQSANELVEMYKNTTDGLVVPLNGLKASSDKETYLPLIKVQLKLIMEKYVSDFTGTGKVEGVTLSINLT